MRTHPLLTLFEIDGGGPNPIGTTILFGFNSQQRKCPVCKSGKIGRKDWEGCSADIIGKNATVYSDYIGGFQSVISKRMLCDLRNAGMTGFIAHALVITSVESPLLLKINTPQYYLIEFVGRVDIDRELFDEFDGDLCEMCHKWRPREGGKHLFGDKVQMPVLESWDGSDFVMMQNIESGQRFCSRRVVDLAIEKKWTGFSINAFTYGFKKPDLSSDRWFDDLSNEVSIYSQKLLDNKQP